MQRHLDLKMFMSHTGGALPYQAGRMEKNASIPALSETPSTFLERVFTDVVSPHSMGIEFAVEFYGPRQVCYGSDYPCWHPEGAFEVLDGAASQMRRAMPSIRRMPGRSSVWTANWPARRAADLQHAGTQHIVVGLRRQADTPALFDILCE